MIHGLVCCRSIRPRVRRGKEEILRQGEIDIVEGVMRRRNQTGTKKRIFSLPFEAS